METTLIQNISVKDFLSNIKAEGGLTTYLAAKTTDHNKGTTNKLKKFIVTSGTETNGNIWAWYTQSRKDGHLNPVPRPLNLQACKCCHCISIHWRFLSDGPNVSTPSLLYMFPYGEGKLEDKNTSPTSGVQQVRTQTCFSDTMLPWSNRIGHVWTVCRENCLLHVMMTYLMLWNL